MKTTFFNWLPADIKNKLSNDDVEAIDEFVYYSIESAVDEAETDLRLFINDDLDDAYSDGYSAGVSEVKRDLVLSVDPWKYHNSGGHVGSVAWCKDDYCVLALAVTAVVV